MRSRTSYSIAAGVCLLFVLIVVGAYVFSESALAPGAVLDEVPPQSAAVVAADIAALTNVERAKEGLSALTVSPLLTKAAQLKAEDMAQHEYYAHVSPDGKSPLYWLNQVGYKYLNAGENLVIDRTTSEDAVDAWMHSPNHRDNILRAQFTEVGIGVAKGEYDGIETIFVVQEFAKPYPSTETQAVVVRSEGMGNIAPQPIKQVSTPISNVEVIPVSVPITVPVVTPAPSLALPSNSLTAAISKTTQTLLPQATKPKAPATQTPKPTTFASTSGAHAASSTITAANVATTSSTTASETIFVLAPEFYTPVTLSGDITDTVLRSLPSSETYISKPPLIFQLEARFKEVVGTLQRLF